MNSNRFSLTENAFYTLKADFASSRSDISELVDDAEFEEQFGPEKIQRAQHNLFGPVTRLEEELSWLPELSSLQIKSIIDLVSQNDLAGLENTAEHLPETAKANLLAHIAGAGHISTPLCEKLIKTWDEIDKGSILSSLNTERNHAGIPEIEMKHVTAALDRLEKRHAETIALGIWGLDSPGKAMEEIVDAVLSKQHSNSMFEKFVRSYDRMSEPALSRIREEIDACIGRVKSAEGSLHALVSVLSSLLTKWDDINQAVQVFEQHHGHEEARSKKIYEQLRELCLLLANERNEFSSAQRLAEALLRTFPELESVAEVLKQDISQLAELDKQNKHQQAMQPLIEVCERAKKQVLRIRKALLKSGFSPAAKAPLSEIVNCFTAAVASSNDDSTPFLIVRDLALHINNKHEDPQTAFKLIDGILSIPGVHAPREINEKLEEERSVLHRNWKMIEFKSKSGNLAQMSRIAGEMLEFARGSDRVELQQLRSKLEKKRLFKRLKWGAIAAIASVFGVLWFIEGMDNSSKRSSYLSAPSFPTNTNLPSPSKVESLLTTTESIGQEAKPPPGQGRTFNRSQVRYCVFQGERINAIRPHASTEYTINRFNLMIADYNSRCSDYRYRAGELTSIQHEAVRRASELQADARRILDSW